MSQSGPAPESNGHGFQRRLGLFDASMLVIGTMIGSGIFVVSSDIARDVGGAGWLMLVWVIAGVMTILGALAYAELAAMMPHAGGQYVYLREAYSPMWGFLYGWTCFLVIQTGSIAAVAVIFAKYLGVLVPDLGTDSTQNALFTVKDVNVELWLPFMAEPFFSMTDFVLTSGHLVAVGVIALLTALNCFGVQEGKIVQNIMTVAKTLALIMLILVGLLLVESVMPPADNWFDGITDTPRYFETSRWAGESVILLVCLVIGGAMVGALFSADAWNNVTFTAGETKNPRRNLPLSLAIGTGTVILLYLLANLAYLNALPIKGDRKLDEAIRSKQTQAVLLDEQGKTEEAKKFRAQADDMKAAANTKDRGIAYAEEDRVGTAVIELWSPQFGTALMAAAIMISTFGCVNGMILMGARLYYVMARDKLFFQGVGTLNRRGVPAAGLILQGVWSILLVFSGTYNDLLDFVIFAVLVFYVLTVVGLFVLRVTRPKAERPYKAFGYPLAPALYVLLCAAVMVILLFVKPKFTWPGLVIVVSGIPVYFIWRLTMRGRTAS